MARARRAPLRIAAALVGLGLAWGATGCASSSKPEVVPSDDAPAAVTVEVVDNSYEPAEVEIEPGQAVTWEFQGPSEHDVVAEDGGFVSDLMTEGDYTHVFDEAGEFAYDCSVHPEMTGLVRVVE